MSSASDWSRRADGWELGVEIAAPGAASVTLLLRCAGRCVGRLVLVDETTVPLALGASRHLDPGLSSLQKDLFPERGTQSRGFEAAVGRLLTLLGYQVDVLTATKTLRDAVDLLAFAPDGSHVFAVECTTYDINPKDKLGKLLARTRSLAEALAPRTVLGLMVTALDRESVFRSDLRSASNEGIAVFCREHLTELFQRAEGGAAFPDILSYAMAVRREAQDDDRL